MRGNIGKLKGLWKGWLCLALMTICMILAVTFFYGLSSKASVPVSSSIPNNIAHIWANTGEDKVTRDELRATSDPNEVLNSVWDGTGVSLFGARNEVVAFNLVLEAPVSDATGVMVTLTSLQGPGNAAITTTSASGDAVFNYVGRNIEMFFVRNLEIRGLRVDLA